MGDRSARTAVIVDDQPAWLDSLQALLDRLDLEVVGRATRRDDAERLVAEHCPDVLIADTSVIASGDGAGSATEGRGMIRRAIEANPDVKCVVLCEDDDAEARQRAFEAGAAVFCVKGAEPDDLLAAIRQSFEHSIYFASEDRTHLGGRASSRDGHAPNAAGLTKRELEILRLAAEGYSNLEVALMLRVSEQTVKFHLSNVYRKLKVGNRTGASRWAQLHGLLEARSTQPGRPG